MEEEKAERRFDSLSRQQTESAAPGKAKALTRRRRRVCHPPEKSLRGSYRHRARHASSAWPVLRFLVLEKF